MLSRKQCAFGSLTAVIYDFENAGDVLPMHNHKNGGAHMSVVARGGFKAKGAGWEIELPIGSVADWVAEQWHEFEATEDNSRLVNIIK